MDEVPFGLAVAAGALAVVNPCGFALLPAYVTLLVAGDDTPSRGTAVARALLVTTAMTAGFVAVFGVFGALVASVAGQVQQRLPWFTVVLGLGLVGLGAWLLAGRALPVPRFGIRGRPLTRTLPSMALFGAGYALASLSCTIGPFLALVVTTFGTSSVLAGIGLFGAYAAGMGLVVGVVSLAVAFTRTAMFGWLRRVGPVANRIGGVVMVLAGGYVAYYGWYEIRSQRAVVDDPVIAAAGQVQRWLAEAVTTLGVAGIGALFTVLLAVAVITARLARRR